MSEIPLTADKSTPLRSADSVIVLNTGDGKGKSSSAFGVMGRAWARGWKIGVVQFVKGSDWQTGERKLGEHLGVEWHTMGDGFTWDSKDLDASKAAAAAAWEQSAAMLRADYNLLILDEITYPINWEWIDGHAVIEALATRTATTNVVLTGRDASADLITAADTVSEVVKVKHAFDSGIVAIKGVDY